jgi:hypothetical protein
LTGVKGTSKLVNRDRFQSARALVMQLVRSAEFRQGMQELVEVVRKIVALGPSGLDTALLKEHSMKQSFPTAGVAAGGMPGQPLQQPVFPSAQPETVIVQDIGGVRTTVVDRVVPYGAGAPAAATFVPAGGFQPTQAPAMQPSVFPSGDADVQQMVELRQRLRRALQALSASQASREGMRNVLHVFKQGRELAVKGSTGAAATVVTENQKMRDTLLQAKLLLREFTGAKEVDPLFNNIKLLYQRSTTDPELRGWLHDTRLLLREGVDNPTVYEDDERLRLLMLRLRWLMKESEMRTLVESTLRELREVTDAVRNDPVANRFASDLQRLMQDIFINPTSGSPQIRLEALSALKDILIGMFMDEMKYFPVPNVSGSNDTYEWAIDNVALTMFELLPQDIYIKQKNQTYFHPPHIGTAVSNTTASKGFLRIIIRKDKLHINNIHYRVRRLRSPRMEDSGIAEVALLRKGLKIKIDIVAHYGAKYAHYFRVKNVSARIDKMKLKVHGSKYSWLLALLRPVINAQVRRRTETAIEEGIWKQIYTLENRMGGLMEMLSMRAGYPELAQRHGALFQKFVPIASERDMPKSLQKELKREQKREKKLAKKQQKQAVPQKVSVHRGGAIETSGEGGTMKVEMRGTHQNIGTRTITADPSNVQ